MGESKVGGSRDTELVSRYYRKPLIEKILPILYRVFEWRFFTRNRAKNHHSLIPCEPRIPQMSQGYVRSSEITEAQERFPPLTETPLESSGLLDRPHEKTAATRGIETAASFLAATKNQRGKGTGRSLCPGAMPPLRPYRE